MPDFTVAEKNAFPVTAAIVDEAGTLIPLAQIVTLVATLYDRESGSILNGRNAQSVLNANGGTVDSAGNLTLTLVPADNAVLDAARAFELHVLLLEWTYASGAKANRLQKRIAVRNLRKVA